MIKIEKEKTSRVFETLEKYFLLTMLLSFLGWAFEVCFVYIKAGRIKDAGFMTLPFCPIYGCSLLAIYFLGGTPDKGRGMLADIENKALRWASYALLAFFIPTLAEFLVGLFFDKLFCLRLWNYKGQPFNVNGYVSLYVSLGWSALIFFVMKYIFPFLKKRIFAMPKKTARKIAIPLFVISVMDIAFNAFRL